VAGVGLVFVATVFRSLPAGVAFFTVITFFERLPVTQGEGVSGLKIAGAALAGAWALVVLNRRRQAPFLLRDHPLVGYGAVLLVGWSLASMLWATDSGIALSDTVRLLQGVMLLLIVFTAVEDFRSLDWIVWAFMGGTALTVALGLLGFGAVTADAPDTGSRLTGQIGDPNELAAILVPALVLAAFALTGRRGPLARWLLVSFTIVFAAALFLTQSRGGLVAFATTVLVAPLLAGAARARTIAILLTVVAAGVTYYGFFASEEARDRVTTFEEGGGSGRPDLWSISYQVFRDRPVTGAGMGNFLVVEAEYAARDDLDLERVDLVVDDPKVVHNTYLHVLSELGLVGFLAFGVVVGGAIGIGWRSIRRFARAGLAEMEMLARALLIGTIGMLAAYAFISAQYEKQLWLLLGLTAALGTIASRTEVALPSGRAAPSPADFSLQADAHLHHGHPRKRPRSSS
jgi:putative inorganic carbon (HCO3(-)) transporter